MIALAAILNRPARHTTTIRATPERIVRLIENFYIWRAWSPYERREWSLERTYTGPARGRGAVYAWEGSGKAGRMEIVDSSESEIMIRLDFRKPFEGHNLAHFILERNGEATNLTWTMHGRQPFMTSADFATGLQNLKAIAER